MTRLLTTLVSLVLLGGLAPAAAQLDAAAEVNAAAQLNAAAQADEAAQADAAAADEWARRFGEALRANTTRIDGGEQPALVPYHAKMETFFRRFDYSSLDGDLSLSGPDRALVTAFAAGEEDRQERAAADFDATRDSICDGMAGEAPSGADAVAYWARVAEFQQRLDSENEARYRMLMNSLSVEGRRAIEDYIEANVVPNINTDVLDTLALAAEFPEWAVGNLNRMCSDEPARAQPVIVGGGHSSGGVGMLASVTSSSVREALAPADGRARALVTFGRIVAPDELLALLSRGALELESIRYRDVGPGSGHVTFSPGVDPATAIDAAEAFVRYRKLAEAYAAQHEGAAVRVPATDATQPGGGGLVFGPGASLARDPASRRSALDPESALSPTRDELDAMSLPPCIADDRIAQPFTLEPADAPFVEAACGFRPYAVTVRGDRADIDALSGLEVVAAIAFDPPRN